MVMVQVLAMVGLTTVEMNTLIMAMKASRMGLRKCMEWRHPALWKLQLRRFHPLHRRRRCLSRR